MIPPQLAQIGAQIAGGLGKGLGDAIGGGGPLVSGGGALDARSFMDGSGWTVATGGSRARGGTVGAKSQDGAVDAPPSFGTDRPMQAGVSPMAIGLGVLILAGAWLWSRRKR